MRALGLIIFLLAMLTNAYSLIKHILFYSYKLAFSIGTSRGH